MQHFKLNNITVDYLEELSLAVLTYDCKFIKHEEFKKVNQVYFQLIVEKKCTRCLFDLTNMGVIPTESTEWLIQEFLPKLNNTNVQFIARVYSKDIFNKVAVNKIATKVGDTPYFSHDFATKADALHWLKNQKEHRIAS